jgi:hypothetical protein
VRQRVCPPLSLLPVVPTTELFFHLLSGFRPVGVTVQSLRRWPCALPVTGAGAVGAALSLFQVVVAAAAAAALAPILLTVYSAQALSRLGCVSAAGWVDAPWATY